VREKNGVKYFYDYRYPKVNKMLWLLKYHHQTEIANLFGKVISNHLKDTNTIVIPIPLNQNDKRMHNHAELLSKEITGVTVLSDLLRKNSSKKQAHTKSKEERQLNIQNSWTINPKYSFPRETKFIILDDVTTTGSTINSAKDFLSRELNIPSENIRGIVVAH
jgi:predicted amidophosphoribosyltransferase